jgi:hypothetical protein
MIDSLAHRLAHQLMRIHGNRALEMLMCCMEEAVEEGDDRKVLIWDRVCRKIEEWQALHQQAAN